MSSTHMFRLSQQKPVNQNEAGFRIKADATNFPALKGMSLYKVVLNPKGIREPHWHANADELGYCLNGSVIVSFYNTYDVKETFLVQAGEAFFIPSGALHYIENVGNSSAELILQFSHENPEEFGLPNTVGMFTNAVLGNTWAVKQEVMAAFKRPLIDQFAVLRPDSIQISPELRYTNSYRFSLESAQPMLEASGGSARMARQNTWPILKRQALYSLLLTDQGMREPHWHPQTGELGYVKEGNGRMSILNPEGKIDTYLLHPGDIYFVPKAYPHHIENLGPGQLHFLIFFDQAMPGDVGFSGSIRSFSNEVLGAVLKTDPQFFDQLQKYYKDLFIVDRINPIDQ
jgi:oxalate decarboxylase